jgi:hypothetical protein
MRAGPALGSAHVGDKGSPAAHIVDRTGDRKAQCAPLAAVSDTGASRERTLAIVAESYRAVNASAAAQRTRHVQELTAWASA